jgi:exo-beta-1,3-glucanase (GH17 family)
LTTVTAIKEPVPTPAVTTIAEPGTYTIPAKTVTLTETTAVCVPEITSLPAGQVTYGGVTTVVTTSTVLECPVPTAITKEGTVTYTMTNTKYECPTPGTYVVGGTTTNNASPTTVEVPVVTVYQPGTYTHPATTVTATITNVVVTCPLETVTSTGTVVPVAPTSPAGTPKPETPAETVVKSAEPTSTKSAEPTSTKSAEPTSTKSATPTSTKSATPTPSGGSNTFIPKDGLWAITYSPYNDDQSCKAASDVDADIKAIAGKGFKSVRLYSSDCGGLESVGNACKKYNLKIILGVFIKAGGVSTADSQVQDVIKWGQWDQVEIFVIGNESVFNGFCSGAELAAYMAKVTQQVRAAGYKGQVTTTEPVNILNTIKDHICQHMDIVAVNIHPFFNSEVSPEKAGSFVKNEIDLARSYCGGSKDVVVLETGWPNAGEPNGAAVPGKEQQAVALKSIGELNGGKVTYFTWRNDGWKSPGAFNVERQFGCGDQF